MERTRGRRLFLIKWFKWNKRISWNARWKTLRWRFTTTRLPCPSGTIKLSRYESFKTRNQHPTFRSGYPGAGIIPSIAEIMQGIHEDTAGNWIVFVSFEV